VIFLCYFNVKNSYTQNLQIGNPEIVNFSKSEYQGGTQNWAFSTDSRNQLLVANNDGLLVFNGEYWNKYFLPNKTIARSVAFDKSSHRIYVGGQDEIGFFTQNEHGQLYFTSLKENIPVNYFLLEDVWNIVIKNHTLYFRSLNRIFRNKNDEWYVFEGNNISFLSSFKDGVIFNDAEKGLYFLNDDGLKVLQGSQMFTNINIIHVTEQINGTIIIFTEKDGLYLFNDEKWDKIDSEESDFLKENIIHSVYKISEQQIAVGTHLGGILILGPELTCEIRLAKDSGLQNNTVSCLYADKHGQLWAGTYNGIDCIKLQSDFSTFIPDGNLEGSVYDIVIHDNKIYCGTENGLYHKTLEKNQSCFLQQSFELVRGSEGQVWGLDKIYGQLIMSHHEGAFIINGNTANKISSKNGAWRFVEWIDNDIAVGGFYSGLFIFKKTKDTWIELGKVSGFDESSRMMVRKDSLLWVSHPYRGIYKLNLDIEKLSATISLYHTQHGLPTQYRNHVFNLNDGPIVAAEKLLYRYNEEEDQFARFNALDHLFSENTRFTKITMKKNYLWYMTEEQIGYIKIEDHLMEKNLTRVIIPHNPSEVVAGFENIYPLDNGKALLMTNKGVKHFIGKQKSINDFAVYVPKIQLIRSDSTLFPNVQLNTEGSNFLQVEVPVFQNQDHTITFHFSTNSLLGKIEYRYLLKSLDSQWSAWSEINTKEFNNIPPGKHILLVNARDKDGYESAPFVYQFQILPPWYRSRIAYFCYALLLITLLWLARKIMLIRYAEKNKILKQQKQLKEARIIELEKEKLQAEIEFKNKELGLSTMHLMQKNETINKIKQELIQIKKLAGENKVRQEIKKLDIMLSENERLDDEWESFATIFDSVHNDFLQRIKAKYPNLSPKDLKLCAYLKMNLNTKEIAPLLNISVRGVEISRYRLRKKLDLDNDTNLNDFMIGF
jgi:DNA-binding CsgD family transcriptional regulator